MKEILLTDDHCVVRAGTALILKSNFKDLKIDQAETYLETLDKIKENEYDLLILDINMPDSIKKRMIPELKKESKNIKILIYTSYSDNEIALQYIQEGADGYLNKMANEKEIIKAVNDMLTVGYSYPPQLVRFIAQQAITKSPIEKLEELSEQELQVFNLLTEGYGNLEISNLIGVKATTVSTYKRRIFEKLDIYNISGLIRLKKKIH